MNRDCKAKLANPNKDCKTKLMGKIVIYFSHCNQNGVFLGTHGKSTFCLFYFFTMGKVPGHGKEKFKVEPAKRTTLTLSTKKQPRTPWGVGHQTLLTNLALKTLEEKKFAKCPVSLCMREFLELPPLEIWKLADNAETIRNMGSLFQHGSENRGER